MHSQTAGMARPGNFRMLKRNALSLRKEFIAWVRKLFGIMAWGHDGSAAVRPRKTSPMSGRASRTSARPVSTTRPAAIT
jgi:hypothetical protein